MGNLIYDLKSTFGGCLVLVLCLIACVQSTSPEEVAIRAVREESNNALAAHDSASLARTLTVDYNLVSSRNASSNERNVMISRLVADWSAKPDLVYRRSPEKIEVFPSWRMASEIGTWVGSWTEPNGDKIRLSGTYYAKWHQVDGQWRIRAEIFTPLGCEGGIYCQQGPLNKP